MPLKNLIFQSLKGRKINIMYGITEADGYPELTAEQIREGLNMQERNRIFRTFVRNTYHHHLQEIYLAITKEYTDWGNPAQHPIQVRYGFLYFLFNVKTKLHLQDIIEFIINFIYIFCLYFFNFDQQ